MKLEMKSSVLVIVALLILWCGRFYTAVIGSDTNITKLTTVQNVNGNDRVGNATWLTGGMRLVTPPGGTPTFSSQFPVSGPITFVNLSLTLLSNLIMGDNTSSIVDLGDIIGNGNVWELASSVTLFPTNGTGGTHTFSNVKLVCNANTKLNNSAILFTGFGVLDGGGLNFDLAGTSSIIVGSNSTLLLRRVHLNNVHGTMVRCLDNTGTISCASGTALSLDGDLSFDVGQLYVEDDLSISGTHIFSYRSTQSIFLASSANVSLGFGLTFSYDPPNRAKSLFQFSTGAKITLNGATMYATSGGQEFLGADIVVNDRSYLACEGTSTANAMIFGDGVNVSNNVNVIANADLEILRGVVIDNDAR